MAVLATVKNKIGKTLIKVADKGGNVIAKASGLTSVQLEKIEKQREKYLSEKPEFDAEGIKRLLGSYAIEAYEAYLPQIASVYQPIAIGTEQEETALNNRIRYFEITKWVSDPTEDNVDKLTNMYHVLSEDDCNIALIYHRKRKGCKVYFAVVNNQYKDTPSIANAMEDRLTASVKGNFPGVEIKTRQRAGDGVGVISELRAIRKCAVAAVSNVASEKSEKFASQSMEKLLDGIVPQTENEEYTIVLLATPVTEQLERKNALSELYSQLAPFAQWQTGFTYTETTAEGSSATIGANLGGSAGRQVGNTNTVGTNSSSTTGVSDSSSHTDTEGTGTTDTTSRSDGKSHSNGESISRADTEGTSHTESTNQSGNVILYSTGKSKGDTNSSGHTYTKGSNTVDGNTVTDTVSKAASATRSVADTLGKTKTASDTIGKMASTAQNVGFSLGVNFGASFARSSNVTVMMGKNDSITQTFVNHSVKNTLELLER